jgi:hypothetical protein
MPASISLILVRRTPAISTVLPKINIILVATTPSTPRKLRKGNVTHFTDINVYLIGVLSNLRSLSFSTLKKIERYRSKPSPT